MPSHQVPFCETHNITMKKKTFTVKIKGIDSPVTVPLWYCEKCSLYLSKSKTKRSRRKETIALRYNVKVEDIISVKLFLG